MLSLFNNPVFATSQILGFASLSPDLLSLDQFPYQGSFFGTQISNEDFGGRVIQVEPRSSLNKISDTYLMVSPLR